MLRECDVTSILVRSGFYSSHGSFKRPALISSWRLLGFLCLLELHDSIYCLVSLVIVGQAAAMHLR